MQHDNQQEYSVGRDPRLLAEYDRLRTEINKLSHNSQPAADWQLIHQLATEIFAKQGIDLQTAVYFSLARAHLHGLSGFTESCELLANLIVTQWDNFWPPVEQERVRTGILDWFIARISAVIRHYRITNDDKRLIYRCEHALQLMSEKLHNAGLSRLPRIENLLYYTGNYSRLFDETGIMVIPDKPVTAKNGGQVPPVVYFHTDHSTTAFPQAEDLPKGSIIVSHDSSLRAGGIKIRPRWRLWRWFLAGSACGVIITGLLACGLFYHQQQRRQTQQLLENPFSRFPSSLSRDDIRQIRTGDSRLQQRENQIISDWQQQLEPLALLPADFICQYTDALYSVPGRLYPDSLAAVALNEQWQRQQIRLAAPADAAAGWLAASDNTDSLINQLLQLERERKSVTISYLKTALYDLRQQLTRQPPAEVGLWRLEQRRTAGETPGAAELSQINDQLTALNYRLCRLRHISPLPLTSQDSVP